MHDALRLAKAEKLFHEIETRGLIRAVGSSGDRWPIISSAIFPHEKIAGDKVSLYIGVI
jgi:hypothetical protein